MLYGMYSNNTTTGLAYFCGRYDQQGCKSAGTLGWYVHVPYTVLNIQKFSCNLKLAI